MSCGWRPRSEPGYVGRREAGATGLHIWTGGAHRGHLQFADAHSGRRHLHDSVIMFFVLLSKWLGADAVDAVLVALVAFALRLLIDWFLLGQETSKHVRVAAAGRSSPREFCGGTSIRGCSFSGVGYCLCFGAAAARKKCDASNAGRCSSGQRGPPGSLGCCLSWCYC